jgi:hypothetical protein
MLLGILLTPHKYKYGFKNTMKQMVSIIEWSKGYSEFLYRMYNQLHQYQLSRCLHILITYLHDTDWYQIYMTQTDNRFTWHILISDLHDTDWYQIYMTQTDIRFAWHRLISDLHDTNWYQIYMTQTNIRFTWHRLISDLHDTNWYQIYMKVFYLVYTTYMMCHIKLIPVCVMLILNQSV